MSWAVSPLSRAVGSLGPGGAGPAAVASLIPVLYLSSCSRSREGGARWRDDGGRAGGGAPREHRAADCAGAEHEHDHAEEGVERPLGQMARPELTAEPRPCRA